MKKKSGSTIWAFLTVLFTLLGFIVAFILKRDDKYIMHYAKIALVLGLGFILIRILSIVPFVGNLIYFLGGVLLVVLWVMALIGALSGDQKRIVLISDIADKLHF